MINKMLLQSIINKYYLGEEERKVNWNVENNKLQIDFTSINKEVIGQVICEDFNLEDSELPIFDTKKLLNLINITQGDLLLELEKEHQIYTKLKISDQDFNLNYALADPLLIPSTGTVTEPEWDCTFELEKEHLINLVKAKNALSEVNDMMVSIEKDPNDDYVCKFIFGDETGYNNKITYQLVGDINIKETKLPFNSEIFKNILNVNKEFDEGTLYLSGRGLIKMAFKSETVNSTYYLVRKEQSSF